MKSEKKLFGKVSRYLLSDPEIGMNEITLLAYFSSLSFQKGHCWPSRSRIKADLGIGDRVLNKSLAVLKKLGYIERHKAVKRDRIVYLTALKEPGTAVGKETDAKLDRYKGLLRFGYGTVYYNVLSSESLSFGAKGVYTYLSIRMGASGFAKPNRKKAVKDLKISDRSYSRYLNELIKNGIISEITDRKAGKYLTRWYCQPQKESEARRKYCQELFLFTDTTSQNVTSQNVTCQNATNNKKEPFPQEKPSSPVEDNPSSDLIDLVQKNSELSLSLMYDKRQLELEIQRITGYQEGLPEEKRELALEIRRVLCFMCADHKVRTYSNGSCVYGKNVINRINEVLSKQKNSKAYFGKMLQDIEKRLAGREINHLRGYLRETIWGYLNETGLKETLYAEKGYSYTKKNVKQNFTGVEYSEEFLKTLEDDPEEFLRELQKREEEKKEERYRKQGFVGVEYDEDFLNSLETDPIEFLQRLEGRNRTEASIERNVS